MSDIVSEIKSRMNIEEVVGQYVQLKQAGSNFKGLCPFHQEKTPSFMVSPEKELAYCFGCHQGGDVIKFIELVEGVEFKEAVQILADKANIDTKEFQFSSKETASKSDRDILYEMHDKASSFYVDQLWNTDSGHKVLEYLKKRGLTDESIKKFQIGLAPDSFDKAHLHLVKNGFSRKMISLSGIAISKDTNSEKVYDRFRMRLIIPIYDALGRIVGFGGRALKKDDQPKYLNSPDSPIYKKSEVMYGYNFAKNAIKKEGNILLVEGYFDVIMSHQTGIENVAATSGTALSVEQLKLLKRITKDLILCFDTDKAGIEAAKRGFQLAQREEMNVQVLPVPGAKDPADYIKDHGNEWLDTIKNTVSFMEFVINDSLSKSDPSELKGKKAILNELIPYLQLLSSSVERDFYIREISQKIDVKEVKIYDEMKKNRISFDPRESKKENTGKNNSTKFEIIDLFFGLLYEYPELLEEEFIKFPVDQLTDEEKSIYNTYKEHYNLLRTVDTRKEFLSCFNSEMSNKLEIISLFIEGAYGTFSDQMIQDEFRTLLNTFKKQYKDRQTRSLSSKIREAEKNGDSKEAKELLQKLQTLVSS